MTLLDRPDGYGLVTRSLHWGMALLMLWQILSALLRYFADGTALADAVFGTHRTNGVMLFALAAVRAVWGLANLPRRGPHRTLNDRAATLGHLVLHLLLLAVPGVALIRQYGSGRGFDVFGLPLFPAFAPPVEWMTRLGGDWHGELGWILFALIAGHVAMALVHEFVWRERTIGKMTLGPR